MEVLLHSHINKFIKQEMKEDKKRKKALVQARDMKEHMK